MKRFSILGFLLTVAVCGVWLNQPVQAVEVTLSDAHAEKIRTNCVDVRANLNRLHASDGLMRVNRGQLYEAISTKLMAPLNSRLVLNRVEPGKLLTLAGSFDQQLKEFRSTYQQYEVAMSRLLVIDCAKDPSSFYTSLLDARNKRQQTHEANETIQNTITEFGREFDTFTTQYKKDATP